VNIEHNVWTLPRLPEIIFKTLNENPNFDLPPNFYTKSGVECFVIRFNYFSKRAPNPIKPRSYKTLNQFLNTPTEKSFNRQRTTRPGKAEKTESGTAF